MKSSEKYSEEIKARVSYEIKLDVQKKAHECGMSEAEYLRTIVMIHLYGKDEVINRQLERLEMIAGGAK